MGNRNRNQSDWNSRENRGRFDRGQERQRFEHENSEDYGRGAYGRGDRSEFSGQQFGQSGRFSSSREEDMRRRGYYGLQQGREDLSEFDRFGNDEGERNRGEYRNYGEGDWGRNREFSGHRNAGSNYGRDYNQNYGQPYSRTLGDEYSSYEASDFDRGRYQSNRGANDYPQQRFGREDWSAYSGGYGGGERWRGTANWGQGRHEGSFDRDRNQGRYGSQESSRYDRQNWGQGQDYDRERDDESLGDRIGKFFGIGPKGWKRSDDRVRDDVSERLEQDPRIDASNIELLVREGEVTLTGSVPDRQTKRLAEDVAENCRGVKDVHNQLRVQSEVSTQQTITGSAGTTRAGVASETTTPGKRSVA